MASLLCSLAWSAPSLITFRVLEGIGGGIMLPLMSTLVVQAARGLGRVLAPDADEHELAELVTHDEKGDRDDLRRWVFTIARHRLVDEVSDLDSRLSRLVDRLEAEKMIDRVACPEDGRAINATITELGRARLAEAQGTHFEGIRRRFLSNFSESEVGQLADFWLRLAPHCD